MCKYGNVDIVFQRLKNWEIRENKKSREYKKEKDREVERKEEEVL